MNSSIEKDSRMELIDNIDKYRIGIDEVFAFKCRACGRCCKNREDILLNARDVYNIATALNLTAQQVIETYCEVYLGTTSRLPIVRLKPKGQNRVCPLLRGSKCMVHSNSSKPLKPVICSLFPLGRVVMTENHKDENAVDDADNQCDIPPFTPNKIEYIINPTDCASAKRKQTVRRWLEMFGIPVEDEFFVKWNNIITALMRTMQRYEDLAKSAGATDGVRKADSIGTVDCNDNEFAVTEKSLDMMRSGIYIALYVAYDTGEDFDVQFEINVQKITGMFAALEQVIQNNVITANSSK